MASKRPPTSTVTLPDGTLIEYWAEVGVDGEKQIRRYLINGKRMPSVSTVAKYLDPDPTGLMYWTAGLTCEGVSQLAASNGSIEWINSKDSIQAALKDAELTWRDVRDQAAQRGTDVHERIFAALSDRRTLPDLSDLSDEHRGWGQAAIRWWRDREPRPILSEAMTASASHGFAGRFDLLAEIDGVPTLVDAKTRAKPQDRISDHVQLAGYAAAMDECGQPYPARSLILILLPDGEYHEVEGTATSDDWFCALAAYRAEKKLSKRMRDAEKARKVTSHA